MEKKLNFNKKLSLEEYALRRVVVNLWNETDMLASFGGTPTQSQHDYCKKEPQESRIKNIKKVKKITEDMVKDKVSKLVLPKPLKERMMHLARPIGSEISKWLIYHEKVIKCPREDFHIGVLQKLHWTSAGVLDYQKTAEELVSLEMLDVAIRYKLACFYCLTEYIPVIWEELPDKAKKFFYQELYISIWKETQMEAYWAYILMGDESKLDSALVSQFGEGISYCQYAFEGAARLGNKTATEYFYFRLTDRERRYSIFRTMYLVMTSKSRSLSRMPIDYPKERISDILCFLLSVMPHENQMRVFLQHPGEVLGCFSEWPWHDFFPDVADTILTVLPEERYQDMFGKMIEFIKDFGYYFPDLIQKFILSSNGEFRKYFAEFESRECRFFPEFCNNEDTETIKVLFKVLSAEDRSKLISSRGFYAFIDDLMIRNKSELMKLCFREVSLTKKEKETLKKHLMDFHSLDESQMLERRRESKGLLCFASPRPVFLRRETR